MNSNQRMAKVLRSNVSSICFAQLRAVDRCPEEFLALSQSKPEPDRDEVIGNVTHAIAEHGKESRVVSMLIKNQLEQLPQEERAVAQQQIETIVANAQEMERNDQTKVTREPKRGEVTYRWRFEDAACTLCARPDRTRVVEEQGEEILEIIDYKKGSAETFASRKDREQLFFFGLVVSKALGWTGKVRMVVKYWGSKTEFTFWFSQGRAGQQLREIKVKIERIRAYIAANSFPAKPGFWCKRCPIFAECQAGQRYDDLVSGRYRPDAEAGMQAVC